MKLSKPLLLILLVLLIAIGIRLYVYSSFNRLLPLGGLYVDEKTYTRSPVIPESSGFSRPPGMFVLAMITDAADNPIAARLAVSLLSLLPATALFLTFRKTKCSWVYICCGGLVISPFIILSGLQFLPAVPAAALLSFSMFLAKQKKLLFAGFLAGIATLFRAELILIPAVLLFITFRTQFREWSVFTIAFTLAVIPVIILNISSGAGPVIAVNGAENLWLGTEWELIGTPPGTEFEQLMAIEDAVEGGDPVFFQRAMDTIQPSPLRWLGMGMQKIIGFFTIPGPGRNIETGWVMKQTMLILLLPLTLLALSTGVVRCFDKSRSFWHNLAVSIICTGIISAFVFFPSARFRTAVIPAFWFLAAATVPDWKHLRVSVIPAIGIILISLFITYPGMERSGLTTCLAAEQMIESGNPLKAQELLKMAEDRGFYGSDIHNLNAVSLSLLGHPAEGLNEFEQALEIAPESPTLWKNYAVSLWTNGRYMESVHAAQQAVNLNPLLREQLEPILVHAENI